LLLQNLKHKINNHYRINMLLDNLPVTVYDLMDEVSGMLQVLPCCSLPAEPSPACCRPRLGHSL
jgi:hypothetical protein